MNYHHMNMRVFGHKILLLAIVMHLVLIINQTQYEL